MRAPWTVAVLALIWCVVVVDAVLESAAVGAKRIVVFGQTLFDPGTVTAGITVLCLASATAGLAAAGAVAYFRSRSMKLRMAEELRDRWEMLDQEEAARTPLAPLLPTRIAELQRSIQRLTAQRDELLDEVVELKEATTTSWVDVAYRSDSRREEAPADPGGEPIEEEVVAVPPIDEEMAQDATPQPAARTSRRPRARAPRTH